MAFLHPHALLLAGLVGVLIALYLRDRFRTRVEVPSLLLWERIPAVTVTTRQFRPDALFFLRLGLLCLLILGLADPYLTGGLRRGGPERYVFVLDTSASMQAREGRLTRFEAARDALRQRLGTLQPNDEAMLITTARSPSVVSGFTRDHAALLSQVSRLEPVDTGTHLELALAVADSARPSSAGRARIEVFTDTPPPAGPRPERRRGVTFRQFGKTDDNVAIGSLDIFQGRFQGPEEARARLVVRNFSGREKHGSLTITVTDAVIEQRGFSLPEYGERTFTFARFPTSGLLRARIEVDDALAIDNQAFGWIRPARPVSVLLVTSSERLENELRRIGDATGSLGIRAAEPAAYQSESTERTDILIFDRIVPDVAPHGPALYIFPEQGRGWLASSGVAEQVEILDWNERHPVLGMLRPQLPFPLRRAQKIDLPGWAEPLLTTRQNGSEFPLAFCGERDGRRIAVLTFDLGTEGLLHSDRVNLLLFFLNLLEWLAPEDEEVQVLRTGESLLLGGGSDGARLTDPRGRTVLLDDPGSARVEASLAGEYRVSTETDTRRLFANLMDARESDIGRQTLDDRGRAEADGGGPEASATAPRPDAGYGRWLCALAAAMLLVEWAVAARRG